MNVPKELGWPAQNAFAGEMLASEATELNRLAMGNGNRSLGFAASILLVLAGTLAAGPDAVQELATVTNEFARKKAGMGPRL